MLSLELLFPKHEGRNEREGKHSDRAGRRERVGASRGGLLNTERAWRDNSMGKCERCTWPDLLTIYEALAWGCTVALEYLLNELYTERDNTSHKLICDALLLS